jgi:hypothetical protein
MSDLKKIHNPQYITGDKNRSFSFFIKHHFGLLYNEYIKANNKNQLDFCCLEEVIEAEHPA